MHHKVPQAWSWTLFYGNSYYGAHANCFREDVDKHTVAFRRQERKKVTINLKTLEV